ncbi:hypothetical protein EH223_07305 [candidate division KSB1 bacterium]|nr:hypothetical protein [candidate division KSB1 bacterium]RQW04353.1 MAG: hypothetical protein EH223_07305 [candidate division KSB1 bacterium]
MPEITLEQTHALLERLAEYVMTQVPTRQEMNDRFAKIDERFKQIDERFKQIDERFEHIDKTIASILSQLDLIRTEQRVFAKTFELHHKRLEFLEDTSSGYRVRDENSLERIKTKDKKGQN